VQADSGCNKAVFASFAGEAKKLVRGAYWLSFCTNVPRPVYCTKNSFALLNYFLLFHNKKADVQADSGYSPFLLHAQKIVLLCSTIFYTEQKQVCN